MTSTTQAGTRRPATPRVEAAKAYRGQITELISLVGTLKPKSQVQVLPKISGRINQLLVDTGYAVRRGALIAEIEDDEIQHVRTHLGPTFLSTRWFNFNIMAEAKRRLW